MAKFYDPDENPELPQIEAILRKDGIDYFLRTVNQGQQVKIVINVSAIDFPAVKELLLKHSRQ